MFCSASLSAEFCIRLMSDVSTTKSPWVRALERSLHSHWLNQKYPLCISSLWFLPAGLQIMLHDRATTSTIHPITIASNQPPALHAVSSNTLNSYQHPPRYKTLGCDRSGEWMILTKISSHHHHHRVVVESEQVSFCTFDPMYMSMKWSPCTSLFCRACLLLTHSSRAPKCVPTYPPSSVPTYFASSQGAELFTS